VIDLAVQLLNEAGRSQVALFSYRVLHGIGQIKIILIKEPVAEPV
jgi:hypothetical protein